MNKIFGSILDRAMVILFVISIIFITITIINSCEHKVRYVNGEVVGTYDDFSMGGSTRYAIIETQYGRETIYSNDAILNLDILVK